jgi:predicted RNA-binding protein (virulence factor B family)
MVGDNSMLNDKNSEFAAIFVILREINIKYRMIHAGQYHELTVSRISDFGLYLTNTGGDEVLLPNRYVSLKDVPGDVKRVFVYHDSEDRLVATTEEPLAVAGGIAYLQVVDKNDHGAFLDWGLSAKHLFLPNRNQQGGVIVGRKYLVHVYEDSITGRAVASMKLRSVVANDEIGVEPGQQVDLMVASESEIGWRVIVNGRHWGMLYKNQIFVPVRIGDRLTGFVRRVTEDKRIDVAVQKQGYDEVKDAAERLLTLIRENGGVLPLGDRSNPEDVARVAAMSKKVFKRALGSLMKRGDVIATDFDTKLIQR